MRLTRFEVRGYKNLGAAVCLDELAPVNIIHGDNNIGKSNLLEAVGLLFALLAEPFQDRGIMGVTVVPYRDPWHFGADDWSQQFPEFPSHEMFHSSHPRPIELGARFAVEVEEWRASGLHEKFGACHAIELDMRVTRVLDRIEAGIERVRLDPGGDLPPDPKSRHQSVRDLMRFLTANDQVRPAEQRFVRIDEHRERHPVMDLPDPWLALYDAKESLDRVHLRRWELFETTMARFADILGPGRFVPLYDRTEQQAFLAFQTADMRMPLWLLGSGVQQLATLIGLLLTSNTTIVALEEPELNLRYTLQERLREVFQAIADADTGPSQIIMTSHSPAFETGTYFYHMQSGPDGPEIARRPISEAWMATAHTLDGVGPRGRAPLSYVSSDGVVRLPPAILQELGLEHGGGVVVWKRAQHPYVELLTDRQFLDDLGMNARDEDDHDSD